MMDENDIEVSDSEHNDINSLLEAIQPSEQLLRQLKVEPTTPVSSILSLSDVPQRPGSRKFDDGLGWFSKVEPNAELPTNASQLVIPSMHHCVSLDGLLVESLLTSH